MNNIDTFTMILPPKEAIPKKSKDYICPDIGKQVIYFKNYKKVGKYYKNLEQIACLVANLEHPDDYFLKYVEKDFLPNIEKDLEKNIMNNIKGMMIDNDSIFQMFIACIEFKNLCDKSSTTNTSDLASNSDILTQNEKYIKLMKNISFFKDYYKSFPINERLTDDEKYCYRNLERIAVLAAYENNYSNNYFYDNLLKNPILRDDGNDHSYELAQNNFHKVKIEKVGTDYEKYPEKDILYYVTKIMTTNNNKKNMFEICKICNEFKKICDDLRAESKLANLPVNVPSSSSVTAAPSSPVSTTLSSPVNATPSSPVIATPSSSVSVVIEKNIEYITVFILSNVPILEKYKQTSTTYYPALKNIALRCANSIKYKDDYFYDKLILNPNKNETYNLKYDILTNMKNMMENKEDALTIFGACSDFEKCCNQLSAQSK